MRFFLVSVPITGKIYCARTAPQQSISRNRQTLSTTRINLNTPRIRKSSHNSAKPVPLIMLERAITLKCRIGLIHTSGCSQCGTASAGVTAPEAVVSKGLKKNW
jgi:hypothetical protein